MGIYSHEGNITLGWKPDNINNSILVKNYRAGKTITIAEGQALKTDGQKYYGVLNGDQISAIAGKTLIPAHMHAFSYLANGETITATCNSTILDCELRNQNPTLTIGQPGKTVYGDAGSANATLTKLDDFNNATMLTISKDDIVYKQGTTELSGAPTDAGEYTASITAGTATATVSYTIVPKEVTNPTIELSGSTVYTGAGIEPTVTVKDGDTEIPASEYTVSYANNVNAAAEDSTDAPTVTITDNEGGNYTVSGNKTFTISPAAVEEKQITIGSLTYNRKTQEPEVLAGGTTLTAGVDYNATYYVKNEDGTYSQMANAPKDAREYKIGLVFKDNYTGTVEKAFLISPKELTIKWTGTELIYNGTAQYPVPEILDGLIEGDDCTVVAVEEESYGAIRQINANTEDKPLYTALAKLEGADSGNYDIGKFDTRFTIAPRSISGATVTLDNTSFEFTGADRTVNVTGVTLDGKTLVAGTEYEVISGTGGRDKGSYTVTVRGKGNYKDEATALWSIGLAVPVMDTLPTAGAITYGQTLADSAISGGVVKLGETAVPGMFSWKDRTAQPAVLDSQTTEYEILFSPEDADNIAVISARIKVTVNKADLTVTGLKPVEGLVATGSALSLVTAGSVEGNYGTLYYAVTTEKDAPAADLYSTALPTGTAAGTYYVWYKAMGDNNHNDTIPAYVTVTIAAAPEPQKTDISKAKISAADQEYTGKEIKPKLTVKLNGKKLTEKKDYTAAFKFNKEIGKASVTITGTGDYTGTATGSFLIVPKKVASPKLTAEKGKKETLMLSWKAGKGIDGYEIEYGLKKDFKGAKKIKIKGAKNDKYEIKKLTAKKTYYVRIRTWKKVKGKTYYSVFSKTLVKKVK